jgi:hypothetical protein
VRLRAEPQDPLGVRVGDPFFVGRSQRRGAHELSRFPRGPVTMMAFTVADGAITAIRALADPDRLAQIVPSLVTDRE